MKQFQLYLIALFTFVAILISPILKAQVNTQDSLALVDLYNSTNGANWTNHTNWLTSAPVSSWYGVNVISGGVNVVHLVSNNLTGTIPVSIGQLSNLQELFLDSNHIAGIIPASVGNLSNLVVLGLNSNQLTDSIPSAIGNLAKLQSINFSLNKLTGVIPSSLGSLSGSLRVLGLDNNKLSGTIPLFIANLTNLTNLSLEVNQLTGNIPDIFANLTKLTFLNISYNNLGGNIPTSVGKLSSLTYLALVSNKLSGTIPDFIGNLTKSRSLYLYNNQLSGNIPTSIGNLTNLQYLYLANNQLTGNIPTIIGNFSNLIFLDLDNNQLTGGIPVSLGNLHKLTYLYLYNNQLSDTIPAIIGNITKLTALNLSNNNLSGTIPASLGNLVKLTKLSLSNNNFTFDGMELIATKFIFARYSPQAIVPLVNNNNILSVSVGGTPANDTFRWYKDNVLVATNVGDSTYKPTLNGKYHVVATNAVATQLTLYSETVNLFIGSATQDSLALVDLYNSTDGTNWTKNTNWLTKEPLSSWYGVGANAVRVDSLDLGYNQLMGSVPQSFAKLSKLKFISLLGNQLQGSILPSIINFTDLRYLEISANLFNDTITSSIGNLSNLTYLGLDNNKFTGPIPLSLYNLIKLTYLGLSNNKLTGTISSSIGNLINLSYIDASQNIFTGRIPASLGNLSKLKSVSLYQNQLNDTIPASLGNLTNLTILYLFNNQLSGVVPSSFGNLKKLTQLELSNNQLSGAIPDSFKSLTSLTSISLNNNNFTFAGIEGIVRLANGTIYYFPQATIPLHNNNYTLSVSVGGTLANDTFKWYKDSVLVATKVGDSSYTATSNGKYWAVATNAVATQLTLYSDTLDIFIGSVEQDRLALIDLYNSTGGGIWKDNTNWLTSAPLSSWHGITVDSNGRVNTIALFNNNLHGKLPASIGNLTELAQISVHFGFVSDTIPASITKLTKLTNLDLGANSFTGSIPASIGNMVSLQKIDLSNNQLSGNIPESFGKLTTLTAFWLEYNNLSGGIPSSIGNLNNLGNLVLQNNHLSGAIPASLGNLTKLSSLFLQNNNFTFDGMELIVTKFPFATYAPQAPIHLNSVTLLGGDETILYVSTGGTPANNTYNWYNNGGLVTTIIKDSSYWPKAIGYYYVHITNAIANQLTLTSDTANIISMPIKSITLQAKESNGQMLLQWQTTEEINTASFIIQHSTDGKTFSDMGSKTAIGKGNNSYSLMDNNPADGTNYYRIQAIDKDGAVSYSKVVSGEWLVVGKQMVVYPNPAKDRVTVCGHHISFADVIDNMGKTIKTISFKDAINPSIPVSNLGAGVYYIHIKTTAGEYCSLRLIKQ